MSKKSRKTLLNEDCIELDQSEGDADFFLSLCGISYCRPDYHIVRYNSPLYVFEYVCSGSGHYCIDKLHFLPQAGDVYIAPPFTNYEYWTSASDPWVKIWFNVQGRLIDTLMEHFRLKNIYYLPQCPQQQVFKDCLEMIKNGQGNVRECAELAIHKLLFNLGRYCTRKIQDGTREGFMMRNFIDNNLLQRLRINDLSRLIGKSPSQVIRIFKQNWNITPHQYQLDGRLGIARKMLLTTGKSIKEITLELNFGDEFYFSHIFKDKFGLSPRGFRQAQGILPDPRTENLELI